MKTYLYRCYDRSGALLYVGITDALGRRMAQHASGKPWWGDVADTTSTAFGTREQALWAEWAVITTCRPAHNVRVAIPPASCPNCAHEPATEEVPMWAKILRLVPHPTNPDEWVP